MEIARQTMISFAKARSLLKQNYVKTASVWCMFWKTPCSHGRRKGGKGGLGLPWILKISAKKVLSLVSSGKSQISQLFTPLANFWKTSQCPPPWKNPSDAHAWSVHDVTHGWHLKDWGIFLWRTELICTQSRKSINFLHISIWVRFMHNCKNS